MWLGIDFGTSNSCAAVVIDGAIHPVLDTASNSAVFPSSIYVDKDGQILVGQMAENKQSYDIKYYQRAIKRVLGQKAPFILGKYQKYPLELVTAIIKKMKSEAERQITHAPLSDAVITVPARYEKPLCDLMYQAAQDAGFSRIEILEEPVAAAVYYASQAKNKAKDGEIFLVFDLGGGTFDASLIRRRGLRYEVLGSPDGRPIGGEEFDELIYRDISTHFSAALTEKLRQPQSRADRMRLAKLCRRIKHDLSARSEIRENIVIQGQVTNYQLPFQQFTGMIQGHIDEMIDCCEALLKRATIKTTDVRCVLLVGGSGRIPSIRARLKQRLQIDIFPVDEPELSVAMGAAFYGDALDRAVKFVSEVDALCASSRFYEALSSHLPQLFQCLTPPLAKGIAQKAVAPALRSWQQGVCIKLNDIQPRIEKGTRTWINSNACQDEIRRISMDWVRERLPELAALSDPICERYQVSKNILHFPKNLAKLEADFSSVPIDTGVNTDDMSSWVTVIVAVVMGIIIAHLHFLAALAGPVGFIIAAIGIYLGKGKTEEYIREANLPKWTRSLVLSDDKINTQIEKVQTSLSTSMISEMEKNKADFEGFITEIQNLLSITMHKQAEREARFIWLHSNIDDEQD